MPANAHAAERLRQAERALASAFDARSIAVVGASANRAKWANMLFRRLVEGPYRGEVVAVNPTRDSIEGRPCYPSVKAIPFVPDYVQVVVPRGQVAGTLRDCVARGVPVVHVLSSGFGEVGGIGPALQAELIEVLRGSATRLIGPNSLGLYAARSGLDFSRDCRFDPGPTTFISQSGSLCTDLIALGQARGLDFGKMLSVGNAADLDWPELAAYCAEDADTGLAAFYVESVRDGRAFFEQLQRLARRKPVLLMKGGRSGDGARSVQSHTGRLAGDYPVWQSMMAQAGVLEINDLDDLLVTLQAHDTRARIGTVRADGLMVVGSGGGVSVMLADAAQAQSLRLVELAPATLARLHELIPDAEELGGVGNPVEIPVDRMFGNLDRMARILEASAQDGAIGQLMLHVNLIALSNNYDDGGTAQWAAVCDGLAQTSARLGKPMGILMRNGGCNDLTLRLQQIGQDRLARSHRLPVFGDQRDALRFLRRSIDLSRMWP